MTAELLERLWAALTDNGGAGGAGAGGSGGAGGSTRPAKVQVTGTGSLPSMYPVTDLAVASIGVAGLALAELRQAGGPSVPGATVTIDRGLASVWFAASFQPVGWSPPPLWDRLSGDYRAADGWIRLHTNAVAHRAAAIRVLDGTDEPAAVARAVRGREAATLEADVVAAGGCAARMLSAEQWQDHPQGRAVRTEPLLACRVTATAPPHPSDDSVKLRGRLDRPLDGIRVLDLTRVIAGPVATRFLAAFGAEVLRVDPPGWQEPALEPEFTVGKRCAHLDARTPAGAATLRELLAGADVLVHGYRPGALDHLGLNAAARRDLNPRLVDVSLDAYGWTGPWAGRRGFDSLVQMSTGIAAAGGRQARSDGPAPLPVQALDHTTGYLLAAAALRGLTRRHTTGEASSWRASLARTALELLTAPPASHDRPLNPVPSSRTSEATVWGPGTRLPPPLDVVGVPWHFDRPAGPLGAAAPRWLDG